MAPLKAVSNYTRVARRLSEHWRQPFLPTFGRLLAARAMADLGPAEFDYYCLVSKPARRWREYLPDAERERLQRAAAPAEHRHLEEDKLQFWSRCTGAGLPTVPVIALLARGTEARAPEGVQVVSTAEQLAALLRGLGDFAGFAKPMTGGEGYGNFAFDVSGGARVRMAAGEGDAAFLFEHCAGLATNRDGYLLQPRLRPHRDLLPIMPGPGLGSLRLLSFRGPDGRVEVPWASLKAPGKDAVICHTRMGALAVGVDVASGRLSTRAYGRPSGAVVTAPHEHHPQTNVRFDDVVVPCWREVVDLVTRAAGVFRELPCLGWDVVVTPDGPVLLETNWNFGFALQQITCERGLQAEFRRQVARCVPSAAVTGGR